MPPLSHEPELHVNGEAMNKDQIRSLRANVAGVAIYLTNN